jgi:integrase
MPGYTMPGTAATVLLVLGVPQRTVMGIMGWSSTAMAAR